MNFILIPIIRFINHSKFSPDSPVCPTWRVANNIGLDSKPSCISRKEMAIITPPPPPPVDIF